MNQQPLSTKDFAALCGLTPATVRQMCNDGRISRAFRLAGGRWRIYPEALREITAKDKRDPYSYQPTELVG